MDLKISSTALLPQCRMSKAPEDHKNSGRKWVQDVPDIPTIASILQKCGNLSEGKHAHDYIISIGLGKNRFLQNLLIQMYGKCGSLQDAREVFQDIIRPNIFSWNIMSAVYANHKQLHNSLELFKQMPKRDAVSWNVMIAGYAQLGNPQNALLLFKYMPDHDRVSWNVILSAYIQTGQLKEAFKIFEYMPNPNMVTWNSMLAAYAQHGELEMAIQLYEKMPSKNVVSQTTMLSAYARHGRLSSAVQLFELMPKKDLAAWNAMLTAYIQSGCLKEATSLFEQMPEKDVVSWTAMLSAYAQHGNLQDAVFLFQQMPERNRVSWNIMIACYAQHGELRNACQMFIEMQVGGLAPDNVAFTSISNACASYAALGIGKDLHMYVISSGFLLDVVSYNALINMYAKCGSLLSVFTTMEERDVISWTAAISAYSQLGDAKKALNIFHQMQIKGIMPNQITLICLLTACCNSLMMDKGLHYFVSMTGLYRLVPAPEHYNCIIDMLSCMGLLIEAEVMIENMPFEANFLSWQALFASCNIHSNILVHHAR